MENVNEKTEAILDIAADLNAKLPGRSNRQIMNMARTKYEMQRKTEKHNK